MKLMKSEPLGLHQIIGSKLALGSDAFGLWMEQGTGKTWTALKVIAVRNRRNSVNLVLIIGPKNVIGGWARQIKQHLAVACDVFTGPDGMMKVCTELRSFDKLTFLVLNYEQAWRHERLLRGMAWDMVVADEAHRLRRRASRQSKALWRIGRQVKYRLALTGTPSGKDEIDLFAQVRFLDEGVFGTWGDFERAYLRKTKIYKPDGGFFFKVRVKPASRKKIAKKVAPYIYRVQARKALPGLPSVIDKAIYFPLTGRAKRAYEVLESELVIKLGEGFKVTTPLAITNLIRLSQLTGGYVGADDGETLVKLEQDKLAHFEDWLEDIPKTEKLVVFARHTHEVDALAGLMAKQKRSYVIRDGRTKKKYLNAWMDFQDKPHPQVYIAQIASGGIGTDLFKARYGIFYSVTHSWIDYDQARKRIDRNGQKRNPTFLHLIAENTIDEDLYKALHQKRMNTDAILRRMKRRRTTTMAKSPPKKKAAEPVAETPVETPAPTKRAPPPRKSPDFGVPRIAEKMGISGAEVRVLLRKGDYADKYKTEAGWDFGDQKTVDKVAAELTKADGAEKKAKADAPAKAKKAPPKAKTKAKEPEPEPEPENEDEDEEEDEEEDEDEDDEEE